jgi:hypothetical protein
MVTGWGGAQGLGSCGHSFCPVGAEGDTWEPYSRPLGLAAFSLLV